MTAARPGGQWISMTGIPKTKDSFTMTHVEAFGFWLIAWTCYPIIKLLPDNLRPENIE